MAKKKDSVAPKQLTKLINATAKADLKVIKALGRLAKIPLTPDHAKLLSKAAVRVAQCADGLGNAARELSGFCSD